MHDALRNPLMVEMGDLLPEVFEQGRPRAPAFREFWLSEIGVPRLVVSTGPSDAT